MGASVLLHVPCSKGAVCYCLDEFSKGRGARSRVSKLKTAVDALAPTYTGLAEVFGEYLLPFMYKNAAHRKRIVAHLQEFWFDRNSAHAYFPGHPIAHIYGEGLSKALELSLNGQPLVPINSWWILDIGKFRMLTLTDVDSKGVTIGGRVTLLIVTPRPQHAGQPTAEAILGTQAQARLTEQGLVGQLVTTRPVRDIRE